MLAHYIKNEPSPALLESFVAPQKPVRPLVCPYTSCLGCWTQSRGLQQHSACLWSAFILILSPRSFSPVGSVSQRSISSTRKAPASSILILSYKQTGWVGVEWRGWMMKMTVRELLRSPPSAVLWWVHTVAALNIQQEVKGWAHTAAEHVSQKCQ